MRKTGLSRQRDEIGNHYFKGSFQAMASPCDLLMEIEDEALAQQVLDAVAAEAWRIEDKFSRYREGNIVYRINHADGQAVEVDDETVRLLDFADALYEMSEGMFDITSGVLRRVWRFDGSDNIPSDAAIEAVLQDIGWHRVARQAHSLRLPAGMEIDFGGIGKEYAVDRCVQIVRALTDASVLVNFGGDLALSAGRRDDRYWAIGRLITGRENACGIFQLYRGAIATSGDAHRYLLRDGIRYSHILNPKTGRSIIDAPHTVSVAAPTCIQAGMLSTLAMLHGAQAEAFLKLQEVEYWID